jgi:hypothetical protein
VLTIVASKATTTAEAAMPDMASSNSRREAGVSLGGGAEAGALEGVGADTVIRVNTYK